MFTDGRSDRRTAPCHNTSVFFFFFFFFFFFLFFFQNERINISAWKFIVLFITDRFQNLQGNN